MQERNKDQQQENKNANEFADRNHGMQGIDKAPGEETSQDNVHFQQETQKAKQPVDADITREGERPAEQDL